VARETAAEAHRKPFSCLTNTEYKRRWVSEQSPEKRDEIRGRVAESTRNWWANLTPERKLEINQRKYAKRKDRQRDILGRNAA